MLLEDLSPKEIRKLNRGGFDVVDSVVNGDYEMYLLVTKPSFFFPKPLYEIGLQRKGYHFVDQKQINATQHEQRGKVSIKVFKDTIDKWLSKYHRIYADSENRKKSNSWQRILTKLGYQIKQDQKDGPKYFEG